jgi:hypothetical protein
LTQYEKRKQKEVKTKKFYNKAKPKPIKVEKEQEEWVRAFFKSDTPSQPLKKVEKDITYEYEWERNLTKGQASNLERVKTSWFFKDFIAIGLTPFTKEWRAASLKATKEIYYKNMTPEQRKKRNEKRLARRRKNIEEERRRDREKKKRKVERIGRDELNRIARERYQREKLYEAAQQRARRHERDPSRAIRANTQLYLKGLLTDEQYVKSVDECVERAKQAEHQGLGRRERRIKKERHSGQSGT